MTTPNALHHLAISTADMKGQIEYFSDVLGMELVALYWMHGVEGAWHGFMRLGDESVAFVFTPQNESKKTVIGQTHAGNGGNPSAPGTMQHLALNVSNMEDLLNMRDRIRSRNVPVFGPIDHGMCSSIYFAGPENLALEIATSGGSPHPLDKNGTWIDAEVVELAGINQKELERYMKPAVFEGKNGALPQPDYDPSKPNLTYPEDLYQKMLKAPDEANEALSITTPPNLASTD